MEGVSPGDKAAGHMATCAKERDGDTGVRQVSPGSAWISSGPEAGPLATLSLSALHRPWGVRRPAPESTRPRCTDEEVTAGETLSLSAGTHRASVPHPGEPPGRWGVIPRDPCPSSTHQGLGIGEGLHGHRLLFCRLGPRGLCAQGQVQGEPPCGVPAARLPRLLHSFTSLTLCGGAGAAEAAPGGRRAIRVDTRGPGTCRSVPAALAKTN